MLPTYFEVEYDKPHDLPHRFYLATITIDSEL